MSKYIKLEDLKWHSPDESIVKPLIEFYITENDIADLPTIEVSEDCISREYAIEVLSHIKKDEQWRTECIDNEIRLIKLLPSVIPKPKEGEWIEKGIYDNDDGEKEMVEQWQSAKCSICGRYFITPYLYYFDEHKYCPHCGAKMKGADDVEGSTKTDSRNV